MSIVKDGRGFELFENALIAFVLSGVLWNGAAGHGLVAARVVPAGIVLTMVLLFAVFAVDTITGSPVIDQRIDTDYRAPVDDERTK